MRIKLENYSDIICVAGKNTIAIDAVKHLLTAGVPKSNIVGVINRDDFGKNSWQPSYKNFLELNGIKIRRLDEMYELENLILMSLEFDRIIKPQNFRTDRLFNIHFSMLPKYKGMYTSVWPLLNGEDKTGVTLHLMDRGIDTGPIIDQMNIKIDFEDTSFDLYQKSLLTGVELFRRNIKSLMDSKFEAKPQSQVDSSYYSTDSIDFSNIDIDFNRTAFQVHNAIRAYCFRPFQLPVIHNQIVYKSEVVEKRSDVAPGTVIERGEYYMVLATIDYNIKVWIDKLNILFESIRTNDMQMVSEIINSGYSLDEKNKDGWVALNVAIFNNRQKIFDLLISSGADIMVKNNNGTNLLMYSLEPYINEGITYYLEKLLDKGIDVTSRDSYGKNFYDWVEERCPELQKIIK